MAEINELPPQGPLAEGLSYWTRIKGERDIPLYVDIDPVDMRRFLANVILVDALSSPRDFLLPADRFKRRQHHFEEL